MANWIPLFRKRSKLTKRAGSLPEERQLFHGTSSETVKAICQQGFDWRVCGKHGTLYGNGSYFATSAVYSHNYTKRLSGSDCQHKQMFLSRVIVGSYASGPQWHGQTAAQRPPEPVWRTVWFLCGQHIKPWHICSVWKRPVLPRIPHYIPVNDGAQSQQGIQSFNERNWNGFRGFDYHILCNRMQYVKTTRLCVFLWFWGIDRTLPNNWIRYRFRENKWRNNSIHQSCVKQESVLSTG